MIIHVINVEKSTKPAKTGKGTYDQLEVAYKDENGKVNSKALFSFANKEVFTTLEKAGKGDTFDVVSEKNDKGFWNWTAVKAVSGVSAPAEKDASSGAKGNTYVDPRETREERELRQKHIIRQSCLAQAVAYAGSEKDTDDLLQLAEQFEAWVTREDPVTIANLEDDVI